MAGFAAPEQANPCRKEPTCDKPAQENENRLPNDHRDQPIGDGAAHDGIRGCEKEKVDPANEQEPAESAEIIPNEFEMRSDTFAQGLIMERERNLDRTESDDQSAHQHALDREIVKHVGNVHEVSEQERKPHNQKAHQRDDAGPFQNVTEPAHAKAEKLAFLKTQTADPGEANRY